MLQANQMVLMKVDDHEYMGPIKRMYQTFFRNPNLFMKYNEQWKPVTLIASEEKRQIIHLTTENGLSLYASEDQIIMTPGTCRFMKDLLRGDLISVGKWVQEEGSDKIASMVTVDQVDDWLFTVKTKDLKEPYFTLKNGIVLRGDL